MGKIDRKANAFSKVLRVFEKKRTELSATMFVAAVFMVITATVMYYIEHDAQPDAFASIPDSMWWATAALTTVGYGDVVPHTPLGKVVGALSAFIGIGFFALPAGILGSGFVDVMNDAEEQGEPELASLEQQV